MTPGHASDLIAERFALLRWVDGHRSRPWLAARWVASYQRPSAERPHHGCGVPMSIRVLWKIRRLRRSRRAPRRPPACIREFGAALVDEEVVEQRRGAECGRSATEAYPHLWNAGSERQE